MAGENVEVPITLVQAQINIPFTISEPVFVREGENEETNKVGNLPRLLSAELRLSDLLMLVRAGEWSKAVALQEVTQFLNGGGGGGGGGGDVVLPMGVGEAQFDGTSGVVILTDMAATVYAAAPIPTLSLRMPPALRHGQECMVRFSQRVQVLNLTSTGTDGGTAVTVSNQGKPARAILPGTTMLFRYNRSGSTYWADCQWHIVSVSCPEDPLAWDPVRDFGAVFDGAMLVTSHVQNAWTSAIKAPPTGFSYGSGGHSILPPGVALVGALQLSRRVTVEVLGAITTNVLRADYSDRNGVPGEDAMITLLDDGIGQSGLIVQGKLINLALDGRRTAIGDDGSNTNPMRAHIRHGILVDAPDDGTDRVFAAQDLQITNCPGDAISIRKNSQVRGGNWKFTNCRRVYFYKCKDSKVDQIGFGAQGPDHNNAIGNLDDLLAAVVMDDCASMKVGRLDIWTGPKAHAIPLLLIRSCAKTVIDEGEIEGMCVVIGDNNNGNSKSYRQVMMNSFSLMNWKVSSDLYAAYIALGRTANVLTGAGYVAHLKCIDINGTRALECSAGYKLGLPNDGADNPQRLIDLPETPPVWFWFGTAIDPSDPQYADYVKSCGDVDITGTSLTWWEGKDSPGGRRSRSVFGFKQHIANLPHKLKNLTLGRITLRQTGTQQEDEIALDGAPYTTQYDKGLLYLRCDPNWASGDWNAMRKLTDRDLAGPGADPVTGYVSFNVWNWSAEATRLSTLLGVSMTYYMVYKQ